MKTTKSIIAALLAVLMLFSAFSVSVFAALPPLTDLKWNDDFSASFSFEGAAKYSYTIYINGTMIEDKGTVLCLALLYSLPDLVSPSPCD